VLEPYRQRLISEGVLTLTVRARPNARATKCVAVMDDGSLKVDLHAAPEDGEANAELIRFLAGEFLVAQSRVELVSGHRGRAKAVRITR
jgi:uncharacterized protein